MSIIENVSSAIEPGDRRRVRAIAAAILEQQGFQTAELLEQVIDGRAHSGYSVAKDRSERAVKLGAVIVNYLREELAEEYQDERSRTQARLDRMLNDLKREAGL